MTWLWTIQVPGLLALLVCSAFFSSAEVALFSLNPLALRRLAEKHPHAAAHIRDVLSPPTRLLSTILIGNTLVNVLLAVLGYAILMVWLSEHGEWIVIGVMTLLLLIFGEVVPKRIAFLWPEKVALLYAAPLMWIMRILTPLRVGLEMITTRFEHVFSPRGRTLSEEELKTVMDIGEQEGVLDEAERHMLRSVLRLEDLQARDVMTPRVDLVGYDLHDSEHELAAVARASKVRQLVLYRESIDRVEAMLDVRRYLLHPGHGLQQAMIPPLYVPESAPLDYLLNRFIREQRRAAIVVDEYGGTAGIITRGDILEEIIGDIDDEHSDHRMLFEPAGTNRWLMDGGVSLEEINQRLNLKLNAEGVDRLGGWLAAQLERLPRSGDRVTAQGIRAIVRQMRKHRVTLVLIEKIKTEPEDAP